MMDRAAVVLAGGRSSRLWPASTHTLPKYTLRFGKAGNSLLQHTYDRVKSLVPEERVFFVTAETQKCNIWRELPEVEPERIIVEPATRDTGPAIALATAHVSALLEADVKVLFLPSDHVVAGIDAWGRSVDSGFAVLDRRETICYLGLRPSGPSTAYGYIQAGTADGRGAFDVDRFVEKPNLPRARMMIDDGAYWNSGMFICRAGILSGLIGSRAPRIQKAVDAAIGGDPEPYRSLVPLSIDHALHSRFDDGAMVCAEYERLDIGNWDTIRALLQEDEFGNASLAGSVVAKRSERNTIYAPGKRVVTIGVSDMVIAESGENILLIHRDCLDELKEAVSALSRE